MTQDLWESNRSCAAGSSLAESALGTDVLARSVRSRGVTVSADGDLELSVLSVRCRLLNRVDHQQFDGGRATFELQPECSPTCLTIARICAGVVVRSVRAST